MSQFDAAARPMFASFTDKPDLTPYTHRPARSRPERQEHRDAPWRAASNALNLEIEDHADDLALQRDHLEGRPRRRLPHAAPGPGGVRHTEVMPRRIAPNR